MINNHFLELQDNQPFQIKYVKTWLEDYQNYFYFLINESSCKKWSKWVEDKSTHIFPCCCHTREQECIFIETYYKLMGIVKMHSKENNFKAIIQDYRLIANNKKQVLEWYEKHQNIASELVFDLEISIMLKLEPYKKLKIKLDENEFKTSLNFRIFLMI